MQPKVLRQHTMLAGVVMAGLLAACTAPIKEKPKEEPPAKPTCEAVAPGDPAVGNWLSVRREKGVRGELRTLFTLNADGTMAYTEQIKRSNNPSHGLAETGCWRHDANTIVLRTLESNGAAVDLNDPIYTNRYVLVSATSEKLELRASDGVRIMARKMSSGYRLPF
ncbi:hypothetical protein GSY71_13230 [Pusillimonas sp. TS35]|uniref:hypothetical protein n=1 Tax=Paracandidimonas lactea TaxID=2895524 RepID=UPI001367ED34|nr:hypothetical protein [Paracandidimonas lactea]MYN14103.1 hypothetical protein [Pusillimonas sp. TS35]